MDNIQFLKIISKSFKKFLETNSRSNEKLKILHGEIAEDIYSKLNINNNSNFNVDSLGYETGNELQIKGRYFDKKVDIYISKNNEIIAGIGVKFIMQNYFQNSNNYFENMLGETANIRCNNNLYYQIIIIPEKIPYYDKNGTIKKIEQINKHYIQKYIKLSSDNSEFYFHTPIKTLLYIIKLPEINMNIIKNKIDYNNIFLNMEEINILEYNSEDFIFSSEVIFNDYYQFITKLIHRINSI